MAGTSLINIAPGRVVIQVEGLRELSRALSDFEDKSIPRLFAREMREAGEDLAESARAHAFSFSKSGDFANSISVRGGRSGIYLQTTDLGSGVIEFASSGATVSVPAHQRAGFPVKAYTRTAGMPGSQPRALFAAINEDLPKVEKKIADVVERMAQAVLSR